MRKTLAGLSIGLGAAAIVLFLGWLGVIHVPEAKLHDYLVNVRANRSPVVNPDIVLVEINDASIRDLAPVAGRWPWPRLVHAQLLKFLQRGGAKVIAYDVLFTEPAKGTFPFGNTDVTGEASDQALVDAARETGNVIFLADAVFGGQQEGGEEKVKPSVWKGAPYHLGSPIEERPVVLPPFQSLSDAAAGLGHDFLPLDRDGVVRRIPPFIRQGDNYMPSLGIAAALKAGGFRPDEVVLESGTIRVRERRIPLVSERVQGTTAKREEHDQLTMLVNYQAPIFINGKRSFRTFEARHLIVSEAQIEEGETPLVNPNEFNGKIVFVGITTAGLVDVFQTPFGGLIMPGIQMHAMVADSLLSNRFLRPNSIAVRYGATIALALAIGLMSTFLPFAAAATGAGATAGAWMWLAYVQLGRGLWLDSARPLSAIALALFTGVAYRYFVEDYEKRKVKNLFGRYVSKDVIAQLSDNPDLAQLGGKRREMSVLFSDIRGFTTVTEGGNPEELVTQLNEYFSRMVEVVFRHQGTVDKFVGDMVMALFGAPLDDPDHAEHAVQAAIDMIQELGELNKGWALRGMTQLDIGVGINSGDMIAGNIGSSAIMSYTVIGDNVNLGSRLESLNKDYKTRIIMSDATKSRLTRTYETRPLGDVKVKGKTKAVAIHEIVVPAPFVTTEEQTI